jgi:hypothetical protein
MQGGDRRNRLVGDKQVTFNYATVPVGTAVQ